MATYLIDRNNNFNLIRFVAASMVLYSHSFALATGSITGEPFVDILGMFVSNIAVDIFFVISGFLVTQSLLNRRNLIDFISARIFRIYPGLIVSVVFCVFIVGLYFTTLSMQSYLSDRETYRFLFKNSSLIFGLSDGYLPGVFENIPLKKAVNGSLWTLPLEIKMYAILAFVGVILVGIKKWSGRNFFRQAIVALAFMAIMANIFNYFSPFMNRKLLHLFLMFFTGSAFYLLRNRIVMSNRLAAIMFSALLFALVAQKGFLVLYVMFIAYLVIYLAFIPSGIIRQFNQLGDYSYGLYIYAFPVQQAIASLIPGVSVRVMFMLSFIVTLFFAVLSWHFIEKKFLVYSRNLGATSGLGIFSTWSSRSEYDLISE
ncbi:MAG: hypothetical protein A2505_03695 [Deltaproteobacteria bacterium RIFOXYD12_FULL_55_16]|nr:MAG: hypothetical protein A2505_03695 [Deltaproteobacteria bacterium RIFOXYD12_FULL_55_16]